MNITGNLAAAVLALASAAALGAGAATAARAQQRGPASPRPALIKAVRIARLPERSVAAELRNARLGPGAPALGAGAVRHGVVAYRVPYRTVNAQGHATRASGLVAFPDMRPGRLRLVNYGHGTTADQADVPSSFGSGASRDGLEGRWSAELFTSAGFAVAEPDYEGMGACPGRPEYMVARSNVSATLDLLRAAKLLGARRGDRFARGVLVTGFSEGGSTALAVGHALQDGQLHGFRPDALAPVSGPFDLLTAEVPGLFNGQVAASVAPYYTGYLLTAWNPLYHLYAAPRDAFRPPYAAEVGKLFNGSHTDQQIFAALPHRLRDLLTTRYLNLLRHPTGAARAALIRNSTCTGWAPRMPVRFYAARGDTSVPQANSRQCLRAIRARHSHAQMVQLGAVSHNISDFLALPRIVRWFQALH